MLSIIDKQKANTLGISDGRLIMNIITNKLEDCILTLRKTVRLFRPHQE